MNLSKEKKSDTGRGEEKREAQATFKSLLRKLSPEYRLPGVL